MLIRFIGRVTIYGILTVSIAFALFVVVVVEYGPVQDGGTLPALTTLSSSLTTDTWAVFSPETGEILLGNNVDSVLPIASLTKLFTAYTVMESERLHESVTISYADIVSEGRSGKLTIGMRTSLYKLLFPLLIESSNDAGEAIRRVLGESAVESIDMLKQNEGLVQTTIVDGSGLSQQNVSTPRELARFFTHLREEYPHLIDITELHTYVTEDSGYQSNNPAQQIPGFTGGKNGYTEEAGRTFVGTFKKRDGEELGIVVLKSSDIKKDLEALVLAFSDPAHAFWYNLAI